MVNSIKEIQLIIGQLESRIAKLEENKSEDKEVFQKFTITRKEFNYPALNAELNRVLTKARQEAIQNNYKPALDGLTSLLAARIEPSVEKKVNQISEKYNIKKGFLIGGIVEMGLENFKIDWDKEE